MQSKESRVYDVIIIGGSYTGLSAAMSLGRSLRQVLVIDSGLPCNRQTPHSQNFLTQDGKAPAEIAALGRMQVAAYDTVSFFDGLAVKGTKSDRGFVIETGSGDIFTAKKLIFATGRKDDMPDIPGFAECWGISVIHCPYCHGYEFRSKKTGILANGEKAYHLSTLVRNLTESVTVITSGDSDLGTDQIDSMQRNGIRILPSVVREIVHDSGHLHEVIFQDGSREPFDAIYAAVPFEQHSDIPASLGCELVESGLIKVESTQATTVSGVYACGDNSSPLRSVANAVSTGNLAGAMVNMELAKELYMPTG